MQRHGLGYAFYEPASSLEVKPGASGYIDDSGTWHPLVDIMDNAAVRELGLEQIDAKTVIKMRSSSKRWGPKLAETVTYNKEQIKVGASGLPAGIPAEVSLLIHFELQSDFGAVLICASEVTLEGYHHLAPFRDWARKNAEKLLGAFPDILKTGFYIAVTTHSTTDVYINAWTNQSHSVTLGFKAGAIPTGEIAPETEWYRAESASGWNHPICQVDGEKKVVFLRGLKFEYHKLTGWLRRPEDKVKEIPPNKYRGDNFIIRDSTNDDDALEVTISVF